MNKLVAIIAMLSIVGNVFAGQSDYPTFGDPYEPNRNALEDFQVALSDAASQNKKLLIDVGGEWCRWCYILDRFLAENNDVRQELLEVFVLLKVNYDEHDTNEALLSRFPKIKGFPAFIIVDANGGYLGKQDTSKLEDGESYSAKTFMKFIKKWKLETKK